MLANNIEVSLEGKATCRHKMTPKNGSSDRALSVPKKEEKKSWYFTHLMTFYDNDRNVSFKE
jgi:hypothetical protein